VIVRVSPGASVPSAHGNGVVHAVVFDTHVKPAGVGSVTITDVADAGPAFVTVMVYVIVVPGRAVAGPVLVTCRSALAITVTVLV
jgi:hypothetical protein